MRFLFLGGLELWYEGIYQNTDVKKPPIKEAQVGI
jgi:hypothetical protein